MNALKEAPGHVYEMLLRGVHANVSEAVIYNFTRGRARYLTPVFTIGILSFQMYQGEEIPSQDEIEAVFEKVGSGVETEDLINLKRLKNSHSIARFNWRKTPKGLRLIDYNPDPISNQLAGFLIGWITDLNEATKAK